MRVVGIYENQDQAGRGERRAGYMFCITSPQLLGIDDSLKDGGRKGGREDITCGKYRLGTVLGNNRSKSIRLKKRQRQNGVHA